MFNFKSNTLLKFPDALVIETTAGEEVAALLKDCLVWPWKLPWLQEELPGVRIDRLLTARIASDWLTLVSLDVVFVTDEFELFSTFNWSLCENEGIGAVQLKSLGSVDGEGRRFKTKCRNGMIGYGSNRIFFSAPSNFCCVLLTNLSFLAKEQTSTMFRCRGSH